jgi:DNA-binding response OmpR family regulator
VRKDVGSYLGIVFSRVIEAHDGNEAYRLYRKEKPDIILTDIDMPGQSGIELTKAIRAEDTLTPIIIMTAHTKPEYLIDAVELNITRYLVKPFVGDDLLAALEKIYLQHPDKTERLTDTLQYDRENKTLHHEGQTIPLTVKESRLLELLLKRKNHLFSPQELETAIWEEEFVTDSALRALIKNLRKKLPVDCIKNIVGHGYKLVTEK